MAKKSLPVSGLIPGIGKSIGSLFKRGDPNTGTSSPNIKKTDQPADVSYPALTLPLDERIVQLVYRYYREAQFERIQIARKWMRNILFFMGYHELEWNETEVAYEAIVRDIDEYAYPNNYFRSHIMKGAGMYVQVEPEFIPQPVSDDPESLAVAKAANTALKIIRENVGFDALRIEEAINLRLFGNSFRYQYYSTDPQYGTLDLPVYEEQDVQLDQGYYQHPETGAIAEGEPPENLNVPDEMKVPPTSFKALVPKGITTYPKGQEKSECVNPFQVYVRSSSPNFKLAPYVIRVRAVDSVILKSAFPKKDIVGGSGLDAADLSLIYQESIMDLPSDPTQFAVWYQRATENPKSTLIQAWIDPVLYAAADPEMKKKYPNGLYAAVTGKTLLESRNENKNDCWVHFVYIKVPGRFWGDGDDDIIPKQMQLNEDERLIMRNIAYNSVPQTLIDSTRIEKDKVENDPGALIVVKSMGGRPVADAYHPVQGQPLPEEVYVWRGMILQDMEYHTNTFGSAIGEHQPGVNTLGGQQMFAQRAVGNLSPMLVLYKEGNEEWARQLLVIVAKNWLDERVDAVMGINGHWEFSKLKGASINPDKVRINARVIPVDYNKQQSFAQAVAAGLLNPQDPRVQRKTIELFQLPDDITDFSLHAKVQFKEIEKMKQTQQQIAPLLFVQNDDDHIQVLISYMNSDEFEEDAPNVQQLIHQHLLLHIANKMRAQQAVAAMQASVQSVPGVAQQQGQRPQQRPGPQQANSAGPQQVNNAPGRQPQRMPNPQSRRQRARKGAMAKPRTAQPTQGNQWRRQPH